MKKLLLALALLAPAVAVRADPWGGKPLAYTATAHITVAASPQQFLAFQNTSTTLDVLVRKIEIIDASTQAVSGGLMQFWVYPSTQVTHSASVTTGNGYATANATLPSFVTMSTAPLAVAYEGDSGVAWTTTRANNMTGPALPLLKPFFVNDDESATANLSDSWSAELLDVGAAPLLLPANSQRALVFEKRQLGSSDFSAGTVLVRIFYTTR